MPPIRQSQRQRARRVQTSATTDLDQPAGPDNAAAETVVAATRLTTAAASVTARRQWEANVERRLDATEPLRRELREMRTLIQSLVPSVVASTSHQGAPPVVSTSRQGAAPPATATVSSGPAPPPWPTMDGLLGAVDQPMPGIVNILQDLPGDAQSRVASLVLPTLSLHAHVSERVRDRECP